MRDLTDPGLARLRIGEQYGIPVFRIPPDLTVLASVGGGWDLVTVIGPDRHPDPDEMGLVLRTFFQDHEWAVQYHFQDRANVRRHPHTLQLWRPVGVNLRLPPKRVLQAHVSLAPWRKAGVEWDA